MKKLPRLCIHPSKQLYYIRIDRKPIYLGKVGGPEEEAKAEAERLRVLGEFRATGSYSRPSDSGVLIAVLVAAYMRHVEVHYRKRDGRPTSEQRVIALALRPLLARYGHTRAADFGPRALQAVQALMVDGSWMSEADRERAGERYKGGWCRKLVNANVNRVRRMFKWGVSQELVPATVLASLETVAPLLQGRTAARETREVPPAPQESIDAVLMYACRQVADMVRLQLLTGARPGEAVRVRPVDLDRKGDVLARVVGEAVPMGKVWVWLPGLEEIEGALEQDHKTTHHEQDRVIPVGPQAQALLAPYLAGRDPAAPLFSPAEARKERNAARRAARKTPVQPSQQDRSKKDPARKPGERWTTESYAHAIASAIRKANRARAEKGLPPVAHFHPHQLRHNAAGELKRQFGWEVARIVCGHTSVQTTSGYVQRDLRAAFEAVEKVG
jgi:integrase